MRRPFAALVGWMALCIAGTSGVNAADMQASPIFTKAAVAMPWYWTGCYLGGDVGYAAGRDSDSETATATGGPSVFSPADAARPHGAKVGGYLGCDWQVAGPLVLGVEADGEWADIKDSAAFSGTGAAPDFYQTHISSEASVRGRVGYALGRVLPYVTAGVAFAHLSERDQVGTTGAFADNATTRTGWTLGTGFDYAFTNNWIGRLEYRYANFGTFRYQPVVFPGFSENHYLTENVIRAGVAYKFGQ
jgi:outer membrane immunogenic protein